jgi:hypothetical protein
MLILWSDMLHAIGATLLIAEETPLNLIRHVFYAMPGGGKRVTRVFDTAQAEQDETAVVILLDARPLVAEMLDCAVFLSSLWCWRRLPPSCCLSTCPSCLSDG